MPGLGIQDTEQTCIFLSPFLLEKVPSTSPSMGISSNFTVPRESSEGNVSLQDNSMGYLQEWLLQYMRESFS